MNKVPLLKRSIKKQELLLNCQTCSGHWHPSRIAFNYILLWWLLLCLHVEISQHLLCLLRIKFSTPQKIKIWFFSPGICDSTVFSFQKIFWSKLFWAISKARLSFLHPVLDQAYGVNIKPNYLLGSKPTVCSFVTTGGAEGKGQRSINSGLATCFRTFKHSAQATDKRYGH